MIMQEGVYFHEKKGIALATLQEDKRAWVIDKNKKVNHPFWRIKHNVVENLTGEYFFEKSLKGYEYIGEFTELKNEDM